MNNSDLSAMSKHYREIRSKVYKEATRPLIDNTNRHQENKKKLRDGIERLCNGANLDKYCGTDEETATAIWHHMWTKIRYAGIRSQIATTEIGDIEHIFDKYDDFCGKDWNIESKGPDLIKGGDRIFDFINRSGEFLNKQTVGNIPKLKKTVFLARNFSKFISNKNKGTPVLHFITNGQSYDDIWGIHSNLDKIGYSGDLTSLHFMMDIGFPVIKPDIVITKLFLDFGWLHTIIHSLPNDLQFQDLLGNGKYKSKFKYTNRSMYQPVIDLARKITTATSKIDLENDIGWATSNPIREFDIFMVKYGQKPENEFGIERTLHKSAMESTPSCGTRIHNPNR